MGIAKVVFAYILSCCFDAGRHSQNVEVPWSDLGTNVVQKRQLGTSLLGRAFLDVECSYSFVTSSAPLIFLNREGLA